MHTALIHSLIMRCSPSAIVWRIIAVIVFAFNRVTRGWAWSHVSEEVFKRIQPALAYANTSATVTFKVFSRHAIAAFADTDPRFEFWCVRHAVCRRALDQLFHAQTTARVCANEVIALHKRFLAAVTETSVFRMSCAALVGTSLNDGQSSEALAFCDFRHGRSIPYFVLSLGEMS